MMYDKLNVLDEERLIALENIIRQKEKVAKHYKSIIKGEEKIFSNWRSGLEVILPIDKKWKVIGKWSPN